MIDTGLDGWLFLTGGKNEVLRQYTDPDFPSQEVIDSWLRLLATRRTKLEALRADYYHVVAPDKLSVFPDKLGRTLDSFETRPAARLTALTAKNRFDFIIDPTSQLATVGDRFPTYFKTDTHWTVWGAYLAFDLVCRRMRIPAKHIPSFEGRPVAMVAQQLDLGSKLPVPVEEENIFTPLPPYVRRVGANKMVQIHEAAEVAGVRPSSNTGICVVYQNASPESIQKRLVIFGDSFCDYRPSSFTALFAETFAETHFIWSTSIDYSYVARSKPDVVLTEVAERFMTKLPDDTFDLVKYLTGRLRVSNATD